MSATQSSSASTATRTCNGCVPGILDPADGRERSLQGLEGGFCRKRHAKLIAGRFDGVPDDLFSDGPELGEELRRDEPREERPGKSSRDQFRPGH
jgi:hypothetical protein